MKTRFIVEDTRLYAFTKNDWKKTMSVCFDWVQPSNSNNLEWLILFCAWPREKICMEIITSVTYKDNPSWECVFYCCFDHLVHEAVIENRNLCWFFACTRYTIVSQTNRNILWKLFCSNWKCGALLVAAKYVRVWVCVSVVCPWVASIAKHHLAFVDLFFK